MTEPAPEATAPAATDEGDEGQTTPPAGAATTPPPAEPEASGGQDLEYWKKRARDNEAKAKANAKAAQKLQELEDAGKTTEQRVAEETARAQAERDEARAETLRYKAAATHHVSEANFDLLGTGTEEEIQERAKRVGTLEAAATELKAIKDKEAADAAGQQPQGDGTGPVKKLAPGAPQQPDNSYPTDWFPTTAAQRRAQKTQQSTGA